MSNFIFPPKGEFKNKKTGKLYTLLSSNVINTTNSTDGIVMCVYVPKPEEDGDPVDKIFTREVKEFYEKFEVVINDADRS